MNELITEIGNAAQIIATPNCADIATIIISLSALVASIIVANKQAKISKKQAEISEQQNRIALFEKRYEIYELIQTYNHFIWLIFTTANKNEDLCRIYITAKKKMDATENNSSLFDKTVVASHIMDSAQKLCQADFLFSQDVADYAKCLRRELEQIAIMCPYPEQESIKSIKESLKELWNRYNSEKINAKIIAELRTTIQQKSK